ESARIGALRQSRISRQRKHQPDVVPDAPLVGLVLGFRRQLERLEMEFEAAYDIERVCGKDPTSCQRVLDERRIAGSARLRQRRSHQWQRLVGSAQGIQLLADGEGGVDSRTRNLSLDVTAKDFDFLGESLPQLSTAKVPELLSLQEWRVVHYERWHSRILLALNVR